MQKYVEKAKEMHTATKMCNSQRILQIIEEIHEGVCGNHIGGKALALKALREGFYWRMLIDAHNYVKKCDKYQNSLL